MVSTRTDHSRQVPNRDEWIAAGVLDPLDPELDDREALLRFLWARGATFEEIVRAGTASKLVGASADSVVRPGPRLSRRELAWRSALDDDVLVHLWQSVGLPDPGIDVPQYTEADVTAAKAFERLALIFGEAVTLQLMRVTGASLARVAEAAVSAYLVNVAEPLRAIGATDPPAKTELALAHAFAEVAATLPDLSRLLDTVLRHHLEAAIHQHALAHQPGDRADTMTLCVGFTDLVDSTAWARSLRPEELATALSKFASDANRIVSAHGGRLVKLIGDEVMFVAPDATTACAIATDLITDCATHHELPPLRGGVAHGEVVSRDGDYHGEVVHLASRLVKEAQPYRIAVPGPMARELLRSQDRERYVLRSIGSRALRGFDAALEVVEVGTRVTVTDAA